MTRIAVTAASGQLGSEIVKATIEVVGKENVVGLARTPSNVESFGIEIRPGDYESPSDLERSLTGVDAVLLVSGMDAPDKRVLQHRNVLDAAKQAGVSKIVYTSIQGAERDTAFSPVVQSNRQTEDDVRLGEILTHFRPGEFGILEDTLPLPGLRVHGRLQQDPSAGLRDCCRLRRCDRAALLPDLGQVFPSDADDAFHSSRLS